MSILKRKTTTSGIPDSRGSGTGKVIGVLKFKTPEGKIKDEYLFDDTTKKQIREEYHKELAEHPNQPPAVVYSIARDHVLRKRNLELYI